MKDDTLLVTGGRSHPDEPHLVNPPVCRGSTVLFPTLEALQNRKGSRGLSYGRHGTPTTFALQEAFAALEGADGCHVVASGKAAIAVAMTALVATGDHVLVTDNAYGPTRHFCDHVLRRFGVETTYFPPMIGAGIAGLLRPNTKLVFTEAPGSQTFEVQDVPALAQAAKAHGALTVMDNTWATPLFFRPYDHGVDVTIHAATKYVVGHSDAMMGLITWCGAEVGRRIDAGVKDFGAPASPDDCYLALRGLRTMGVRLRHHETAALEVARWLQARPEVARVLHPALADCPGHDVFRRDFKGSSGLFGVVLQPVGHPALAAMLDGMELFGMGYSWGGYESLMIPAEPMRTAAPWHDAGPLLRLHIGLEDVGDLLADLEAGFARLHRAEKGAA
ncbi:MAG: cystathionine beta-lyase [Geminicoccaceae bacterium]|nr:MAG: cystathionine beta-lyase [Geminicoccaceae bacterium]